MLSLLAREVGHMLRLVLFSVGQEKERAGRKVGAVGL
jgi:hypothetical protein